MPKPILYWKPACTTCRHAKAFLDEIGLEMEMRDINRTPPPREFLERHVDEQRFLDFVSKRSPVFRAHPLPRSKTEAIDLMISQPNLIRRPILVDGARVVFGFDTDAYRKALHR